MANVLLRGQADKLYNAVAKDAHRQPARMKNSIQRIALSEDVEVGLLANHVAFKFCQETGVNIWRVAHKLQKEADIEPFATVREILLKKVDIRAVLEPAGGLLWQALN